MIIRLESRRTASMDLHDERILLHVRDGNPRPNSLFCTGVVAEQARRLDQLPLHPGKTGLNSDRPTSSNWPAIRKWSVISINPCDRLDRAGQPAGNISESKNCVEPKVNLQPARPPAYSTIWGGNSARVRR
ncbi:hypothetical protein HRR83_007922 [Exophiala dermatitidis]|uniref:Uncharacterized protein n=1 Tax=Exophiala dermatitidis TaxID=5970 RepID=A0AAN6ESW1_EXODE|nr:hypothetical protein HRR74_007423 [Exophiala dermatitidis]KAJ4510084.1 hypothetical protein HRR73_006881 [Exophiala dermatitidis]KAJ4539087.1 hypothetical protein HRR77_006502 [Exophiala dermatitidis]KAJ4540632.1 hypothetical protein HRR76_004020 [Exophiala dermatitidis]KAJ4564533.1 hypothetical protein HRR79_005794 [Exophiala dermatitidis]